MDCPKCGAVAEEVAGPNQKARIAFWLGIVSVVLDVLSCRSLISFTGCIGPVVGIMAIVLGYLARQEIETQGGTEGDRKKANQGMIMGIVGTVLLIVLFILEVVLLVGMSFLAEMGLFAEF
jgi:hypothetical protein